VIAILIDGIVQGLQFSLMAVGVTLIFGLGGVLNLAHGQFAVVGGVAAALLIEAGVDTLVAFIKDGTKPAQQVNLLTPVAITKDNLNTAERLGEVK